MKKTIFFIAILFFNINAFATFYSQSQIMNKVLYDSSLSTISHEHKTIHNGYNFRVSNYDNDIDIATPKFWMIYTTSTTRAIKLNYDILSSINGTLYFYEGATISSSGTAINVYNSNRNSSVVSVGHATYDPVILSSGTEIETSVIGTDCTNDIGRSGEMANIIDEIIIKPNTFYLICFVSGTDNNRVVLRLNWHEEND